MRKKKLIIEDAPYYDVVFESGTSIVNGPYYAIGNKKDGIHKIYLKEIQHLELNVPATKLAQTLVKFWIEKNG